MVSNFNAWMADLFGVWSVGRSTSNDSTNVEGRGEEREGAEESIEMTSLGREELDSGVRRRAVG
jgi:hypothetical protein